MAWFGRDSILCFKGDVLNIGAKYLFDKLNDAQVSHRVRFIKRSNIEINVFSIKTPTFNTKFISEKDVLRNVFHCFASIIIANYIIKTTDMTCFTYFSPVKDGILLVYSIILFVFQYLWFYDEFYF